MDRPAGWRGGRENKGDQAEITRGKPSGFGKGVDKRRIGIYNSDNEQGNHQSKTAQNIW